METENTGDIVPTHFIQGQFIPLFILFFQYFYNISILLSCVKICIIYLGHAKFHTTNVIFISWL